MDAQIIKQKILTGEMTDNELSSLLGNNSHSRKQGGNFLKTILKGFIDGYTAPNMWRLALEFILILFVVIGIIVLSYSGRIDATITSVLMAFILGFLFGKIK
jgi:lipopolysaccharide export LptBFGC system permease protein LptF